MSRSWHNSYSSLAVFVGRLTLFTKINNKFVCLDPGTDEVFPAKHSTELVTQQAPNVCSFNDRGTYVVVSPFGPKSSHGMRLCASPVRAKNEVAMAPEASITAIPTCEGAGPNSWGRRVLGALIPGTGMGTEKTSLLLRCLFWKERHGFICWGVRARPRVESGFSGVFAQVWKQCKGEG